MTKVVIYPYQDRVALIRPGGAGLSIEDIAKKDVPAGVPYNIVDESIVPQDPTFFEAWTYDFSKPDGKGMGPEAWFAKKGIK